MSRWAKILVVMSTAVTIMALTVGLTGSAAYANTGTRCGQFGNRWLVCINITGSGTYLSSMKAWMHNIRTDKTWTQMHIELWGPQGTKPDKNCAQFNIGPNSNSPNCVWSPKRRLGTGLYCATLWQFFGSGYNNFGTHCAHTPL